MKKKIIILPIIIGRNITANFIIYTWLCIYIINKCLHIYVRIIELVYVFMNVWRVFKLTNEN